PATSDTVESAILGWTATGIGADQVWTRQAETATNHVWHGAAGVSVSDTSLESPSLDVSATDPFIITLKHYYSFEMTGSNPTIYYDGGVIEVSTDGGQKWVDISTYVDPGYGGKIDNTSQNPLQNRMGVVGLSHS